MPEKKHLVIFAPYYLPHIGGLENYVNEFTNHLPSDYSVTIFTPNIPKNILTGSEIAEKARVIRYPAFELVTNFPIPKIWNSEFLKCWKEIKNIECDAVISHTRFFLSSLLALRFAKIKKVELIHTEHGSDFVNTKSTFVNFFAKIYDYIFGKITLKGADKIIAISSAVQIFVKKLSKKDSTVIFRGLEFGEIDLVLADDDLRKAHQGKTIFVFAGRLIKWKGLHRNLEALSKLPQDMLNQISYIIAGDGPDRNELESFAKKNNLPVFFQGPVSREAVYKLMKTGDAFIHGSLPGGGLSTTLIEAMYCELPVIATPNEGAIDVIKHMQNGYIVNDKDVDSLTKAIIWQLKNPAEAKKQALAGKETVINNFSWENNIKKIIKLINK